MNHSKHLLPSAGKQIRIAQITRQASANRAVPKRTASAQAIPACFKSSATKCRKYSDRFIPSSAARMHLPFPSNIDQHLLGTAGVPRSFQPLGNAADVHVVISPALLSSQLARSEHLPNPAAGNVQHIRSLLS